VSGPTIITLPVLLLARILALGTQGEGEGQILHFNFCSAKIIVFIIYNFFWGGGRGEVEEVEKGSLFFIYLTKIYLTTYKIGSYTGHL
jgi:hypothetical protein